MANKKILNLTFEEANELSLKEADIIELMEEPENSEVDY
ncbi:hypothetical protein CDIMF43_110003 [Carnobacterium divergens]|nr:hypothetical protein CDIMF43_110003 [Carnobacterium divergens]